jgi:sugar O-acyltransferase (sialic acid O-acetyltransferase NeuD family)
MKIAFVGRGDLSKQFEHYLNLSNNVDLLSFDDFIEHDFHKNYPFDHWIDDTFFEYNFAICLGYKNLEKKNSIISKAIKLKRKILGFIHPSSFINQGAIIGQGVFIYPMCNIDKGVIIESGVVINNSVTISHDTMINKASYISPGVTICGRVRIGENSFIGAGSIISNDVNIGDNVIVGIGSTVTKDIPNNLHVIGNPLKIVKNYIRLK